MGDDLIPILTRFHREVLPDIKRVVGDLRLEMNERFAGLDVHFDAIYQRFDKLETEYHILVAGLKRVEEREEPRHTDEAEPKTRRRCSPSWARLIAKVFQADPLVCRRCGGPLKVVAYITDSPAIRQILDHLGLSPPEKPPPETPDIVRVPLDDEGREIEIRPA